MARTLLFLVVTFGLFSTAASLYDRQLQLYLDDRYNRAIESLFNVLWKGFANEVSSNTNALIFTIPSAIDISFFNDVSEADVKENTAKTLFLYDFFHVDLKTVEDRLTSSEMHVKTIFYGQLDEMERRMLMGPAFSKLSRSKDRVELIAFSRENRLWTYYKLLSAITESGLGVSCGVKYCAHPIIFNQNSPFSILTLTTWDIISIKGFTWTAEATFNLTETSSTQVSVARGYDKYDYAEFRYPRVRNCMLKVLRLPYTPDLNLIFVVPSERTKCSLSEDLWRSVQSFRLNRMKYQRKFLHVSIPIFNVSADIDMRTKLNETALSDAIKNPASRLYNVLTYQAAEVAFNPNNRSGVPVDNGCEEKFLAERPFFFALFHRISPTPIFAGVVNNPGCTRQCSFTYLAF